MSQKWIPEIMYEDSEEGGTSNIPFIMVPQNEVMPKLLYVLEIGKMLENLQNVLVKIILLTKLSLFGFQHWIVEPVAY